ncbi:hypothetical protein RHMOL_Rhmol11G0220800 [Rhododendron molle]|uniref:Uncharacterized protein n=1 Tax=Rhododendron molle TaxID=49168 RepID=A0ACC0LUN6_RHOML|nr:hypothetical protein RHMOL_Rhmol11G0220800 [Rhododendron molle]
MTLMHSNIRSYVGDGSGLVFGNFWTISDAGAKAMNLSSIEVQGDNKQVVQLLCVTEAEPSTWECASIVFRYSCHGYGDISFIFLVFLKGKRGGQLVCIIR